MRRLLEEASGTVFEMGHRLCRSCSRFAKLSDIRNTVKSSATCVVLGELFVDACDVAYPQWIRDGHIESTPGEVIDYERIRKKINELGKTYHIEEIPIDRWNATRLATQLNDDGFEVVAFGQGYASMNWPTNMLEEVILAGRLSHGGHPVLRWMAGNVSIETDAADNWKRSKKSIERIDGIVALIMALNRASREYSIYNERGMLFLWDTDD